jgi:hypothetical protein
MLIAALVAAPFGYAGALRYARRRFATMVCSLAVIPERET